MAVTKGGNTVETDYSSSPAGIEVPFLVNNNQKWISGIVEQTSCGDIIKALLAAEGRLKGINEDQLERFVLVERWRRVERPLKKESGLLKIWQAWGPEAKDVQFILKRVSSKKVSRPRTNSKDTRLASCHLCHTQIFQLPKLNHHTTSATSAHLKQSTLPLYLVTSNSDTVNPGYAKFVTRPSEQQRLWRDI